MGKNSELIKRIETRQVELDKAKEALKEKFIGIDSAIDKIMNDISLWYLIPELQFRPLIISLWGITGVGKTDLVRTLVKHLNYTDKFVEVQMDVMSYYNKSIESYLDNSGVDTNEPSILLLDEIQRYRTIDEQGKMVKNEYYNDIWTLLSDGKFQNNSERKAQIMEMMFDNLYYKERDDDDHPKSENKEITAEDTPKQSGNKKKKKEKPKNYKYKTSYWAARSLKKTLKIEISVEDIMKMSVEQQMNLMEEKLKNGDINEGKSFEKLLIFISGNLDDAFAFADNVEDSERDADIYHELSKRVNIINIKAVLSKQFKPEQVARFGNNHVIYPSLDKESYNKIIRNNCNVIVDAIKIKNNIKINISDNIYNVIYRNGVFPAQGVRPVISTANALLSNTLPFFMYHAMIHEVNEISIDITGNNMFSVINDFKYTKEVLLEIDDIRDKKTIDEITLVAVHEIGHSLLYGLLFGIAPKQINVRSSGFSEGFVINHDAVNNKKFLTDYITILLGGTVAEKIVFGEEMISTGCSGDIAEATSLTGKYIRKYGMGKTISAIERESVSANGVEYNFDIDSTNSIIEQKLMQLKLHSKILIEEHRKLFKALINETVENKGITPIKFAEICKEYNINVKVVDIDDKIQYNYNERFKKYIND